MPNYRGISPEVNGGADLGSTTQKWDKLYANHVLTAGSLYRRRTRKAFTLADLAAAVADGDYAARDIDVGDFYVGASGYTYILAGDNPLGYTPNVAGLVVDTNEKSVWNTTATTVGGYVSSAHHSYLLDTVLPKVKADLGESHLAQYNAAYTTAIDSTRYNRYGQNTGATSNFAWSINQYISPLSEIQVTTSIVWSSSGYDSLGANRPLEVFTKFSPPELFDDKSLWLRDVSTATKACYFSRGDGSAFSIDANTEMFVAGLVCFH